MRQPLHSINTDEALLKFEKHARFWDALKKIVAALLVVGTPLIGVVLWFLKTPTQVSVETAINESEARLTATQLEDHKSVTELQKQVAALSAQITDLKEENNRRWNNLDRILTANFGQSTATTPPPAFGPSAKRAGRTGP